MKKLLFLHLVCFIPSFLLFSLYSYASSLSQPPFEVPLEMDSSSTNTTFQETTDALATTNSIYVDRQLTMNGTITPQNSIYYQETINTKVYASMLTLYRYWYSDNKTYSKYHGTLYLQD